MEIDGRNIDRIMTANGFVKKGFYHAEKVLMPFRGYYGKCTEIAVLYAKRMINNGRDRASLEALSSCVGLFGDIEKLKISDRGGVKERQVKKKLDEISGQCPSDTSCTGADAKTAECLRDTARACGILSEEAEHVSAEEYGRISGIYLRGCAGTDVSAAEWRENSRRTFAEIRDLTGEILAHVVTALDVSSREAYAFAARIVKDVENVRGCLAFSYLTPDRAMAMPALSDALSAAEEWDGRETGVTKSNPVASDEERDGLSAAWMTDALSAYVASGRK